MELSNYKLWTALVTPFNTDLTVDFDSLKTLVQEQIDAQNGLLILGSTGEALNIGLEDRKKIVEYVFNMNSFEKKVMSLSCQCCHFIGYMCLQFINIYGM